MIFFPVGRVYLVQSHATRPHDHGASVWGKGEGGAKDYQRVQSIVEAAG